MSACRMVTSLFVAFSLCGSGSAQSFDLIETDKAGDCYQIQLHMRLTGKLLVTKDQKATPLPLAAEATQMFPERVLLVGSKGPLQKTARHYDVAAASIMTGAERVKKSLRPDRQLLVAQRVAEGVTVYSPVGPLTKEELELTSEHFDTLSVIGLLPQRSVKTDETWKVSNEVAQALCSFEGLTTQDLTCELTDVKDHIAQVAVSGSATGIDVGAFVKMTIDASYRFDLTAHRLVALDWKQTEERGQGPASPAAKVEVVTNMKRELIDQPASLSDVVLIAVPDGDRIPESMTPLVYHHLDKLKFDFVYGREWQPVGRADKHVVFRLMERGDFVAQMTITPWEKGADGKHMSSEAFGEAMSKTPGWEPGDIVQQGEVPAEKDVWIYRISAPGLMDGIKVVQNFYLVAAPSGEQVILVFTMTPSQVEKLGTRDLTIVRSVSFDVK